MITNELIQYHESLVGRQKQKPAEENPHLREYVAEIRDAWEARVTPSWVASAGFVSTTLGFVSTSSSFTAACAAWSHAVQYLHSVAISTGEASAKKVRSLWLAKWRESTH